MFQDIRKMFSKHLPNYVWFPDVNVFSSARELSTLWYITVAYCMMDHQTKVWNTLDVCNPSIIRVLMFLRMCSRLDVNNQLYDACSLRPHTLVRVGTLPVSPGDCPVDFCISQLRFSKRPLRFVMGQISVWDPGGTLLQLYSNRNFEVVFFMRSDRK